MTFSQKVAEQVAEEEAQKAAEEKRSGRIGMSLARPVTGKSRKAAHVGQHAKAKAKRRARKK